MLPVAGLLALWSALAAARQAPGRLHVLPAGDPIRGSAEVHPSPTVAVALRGVVRVERPRGAPVDLMPGDAAVVAAGAPHAHAPLRRGAAALFLGFDLGACDLVLSTAEGSVAALMPPHPAAGLMRRLLDGDAAALPELLAQVLERPLRDLRPLPAAVQRMREHIRRHALGPLRAADVARASGLEASRAWQVFREHFGCTPRQALERRRCEVAAGLLRAGLGVAETARRCGYADRGTFSRAFTRVHGVAPRRHAETGASPLTRRRRRGAAGPGRARPRASP